MTVRAFVDAASIAAQNLASLFVDLSQYEETSKAIEEAIASMETDRSEQEKLREMARDDVSRWRRENRKRGKRRVSWR